MKNAHWKSIALLLIVLVVGARCSSTAEQQEKPSPAVRLDSGLATGVLSRDITVFRGIPYAAPPTGALRWKPPLPVKPWEGVRRCEEFGPWCPQPKPMVGRELGKMSEDCLTLNVWTPGTRPGSPLPVMVWIHGGGFTTGSGAAATYDGEALARQGVVVVTINYRLGPFGFFAHPLLSKESPHGVSGNYGLLDQICALEWVKRNIGAFGGDPRKVTIFGESAGSVSVMRLMVSPQAKGLFHGAIGQSGGVHTRNRRLREAVGKLESMEDAGVRLAEVVGASRAPDVIAALRAVSAKEILEKANPAQGLFGKGMKFGPVVDGWVQPEDPGELFSAGKYHDVPFITGTNADEGTLFLQQLPIRSAAGYRLTLRALYGDMADEVFAVFPARTSGEVKGALNRLVTVQAFALPARCLVRAADRAGRKSWLYHFTRVPPLEKTRTLGAFHSLEILYIFEKVASIPGAQDVDLHLSRAMSACWVHFAKSGEPPPTLAWPVYRTQQDRHLEFGAAVSPGSGLFRRECDLFEELRGAGVPGE